MSDVKTTTQSGVYGLLFADLLRRWIWHALALCAYVVVFSQTLNLVGEDDVELPIVCHGAFVCLAVLLVMHADTKAAFLPVFVALPVGRARLAAFVWCKLVIAPPVVMTAANVALFVAWGGTNLPFLMAYFALAVLSLGALTGVTALWAELEHRMVVRFGAQRGLILLLCWALALIALVTVVERIIGKSALREHLFACLATIIVVGIILSAISWVKREWLLHLYVEHRQGNLKRALRRRRAGRALRYARLPWLLPVVTRHALAPAIILMVFVLVFMALERRSHSFLIDYEPRVIRFGFGAVVALIMPFLSTTRSFPLKAYRTVPLSSWGLTGRMVAFHAAPTVACVVATSPSFLLQPDGPLFFLSLLCVGAGIAVTAALGREITRLTARIPLVLLFVVFFMMAYAGLFRAIAEDETPGFGFIISGLVLTGISALFFHRNITRSSEVYSMENRFLAKENA